MAALTFGLIAALAWGIHDLLVRYVSLTLGVLQSLLAVLVFGALFQSVIVLGFADWSNFARPAALLSVASGAVFAFACIGHYNAFAKGPIRLVAPLIGTYSVAAFVIAAATGSDIALLQWIAVIGLLTGIALVSRGANDETSQTIPLPKLLGYCALAVFGFAATFALGQAASAQGDPVAVVFIARLTTIAVVVIIALVFARPFATITKLPTGKPLLVLALMGALDAIALAVVLSAGAFPHPEFASAASSIFGLVTVLLAWVFLKEKINAVQWGGVLTIFLSIAYLAAS